MGFLDSFLDFGESLYQSTIGGIIESTMDSLGLSRHGRDQYFNREMQQDFLSQQLAFQREQTEDQQSFTKEMYNQQWYDQLTKYPELQRRINDQNFNLWRQQQNFQNAYNSPQNQMALQMAAGMNPNSPFSQSVGTANLGATSPSQPPQISPTPFTSHASPIGLPTGLSHPSQLIRDIGGFMKDIAQAKNLGVHTQQLEQLFDYEIEERTQRIFGMRLTNTAIGIENYVAERIKDKRVQKASQELLKLIADTKEVDSATDLNLQRKFTEKSEELLNIAKRHCAEEEFEVLKFKVDHLQEEWTNTQNNLKADTLSKKADANLKNNLAATDKALRSGRITGLELDNKLKDIEWQIKERKNWFEEETIVQKMMSVMYNLKQQQIITDTMYQKLEQEKASTEFARRHQFANYILTICQSVGAVLSGTGAALSGGANWRSVDINDLNTKQRNEIQSRVADAYEKEVSKHRDFPQERRDQILGTGFDAGSLGW